MPSCRMVWPQKERSRDVSQAGRPMRDLNHWRSLSTRVTVAMGIAKVRQARRVRRSKRSSGGVSRMLSEWRAARRSSSFGGWVGSCMGPFDREAGNLRAGERLLLIRVGTRETRENAPKRGKTVTEGLETRDRERGSDNR